MQYLGGKSRIAPAIAGQIRAMADGRPMYVEPFLGAGSVALSLARDFPRMILADSSRDLVELWLAVQSGWVPPTTLSEQEYAALRHSPPSALRGFAGFPCSFGGKWFGGFARDPKGGTNYAARASRSMVKRGSALRSALILEADYRDLLSSVPLERAVIYADPPYEGTTAYGNVEPFDSSAFWDAMRSCVRAGAAVAVSEYGAPSDWVAVWRGSPMTTLRVSNVDEAGEARRVGEALYIHESALR